VQAHLFLLSYKEMGIDTGIKAHTWDSKVQAYVPVTQRPVKFLKGPIPWTWLQMAARLPGKSLFVGLALWRLAGAMKSRTVRLANSEVEALGVSRSAKSRALRTLEQTGLITIDQKPGCLPRVTILEVPIEGE
jgi:hypothetical protein